MDTAGSTLAHSGDRWRLNARQASVDTGKRAAAPASDCPQAQRQTSEADQHRAATAGRLGQPHQSLAECALDGQTRDRVAVASTVVQAGLAAQVSQAGGPTQTVRRGVLGLIKQMARDKRLWRLGDKLLFILVYETTYALQTMLGLQFGLSQGRVNGWIHRLTPILQQAIASMGLTPERGGQALQTNELALEGGAHLIIDGTERRRQRPVQQSAQREQYTGKKTHTDKNGVSVNPHSHKVVYVSETQPGKKHDKKQADAAQLVYPALGDDPI